MFTFLPNQLLMVILLPFHISFTIIQGSRHHLQDPGCIVEQESFLLLSFQALDTDTTFSELTQSMLNFAVAEF